jgi:hypothetical protein
MPGLFGECLCLFARMLRRQFNERGRAPALPGIDSVRTATRCRAGSARMAGSISSARQAESYRGACGGFQPGGLTFRAISANSCARLRCCFAASASPSATAAHSSTESSPRSQRSTSCNSACSIRSERLFAVASLFLGGGQGHTVTLPHLTNGPPAALTRQGGVAFIAKFAPA